MIWDFFENMNELVYVSDIETNELVYMNKKAMETYGIPSHEAMKGKKCHEVILNSSAPCSICNSHELEPGHFVEWQYYNPTLEKYLMMKDTVLEVNGRKYRFDMALDVSAHERRRKMINSYRNLEAMINEGLRVALQAPTPSGTLDILMEYLGNALHGERTYIVEKNASGGDDNTYEWVASGVEATKDKMQNLDPAICAGWYQEFTPNGHIVVEDVETLKESNPLLYDVLQYQKVHCIVAIPLYDEGELIGFYGVNNPTGTSLEYASNMLQIMAHFIVTSIKRRNLIRELQILSYTDHLTKLGNRHALEEYGSAIQEGQSIGVVYGDITGLKRVNDTINHEAGDQLIIGAGESLKEAFGDHGLFRIGGDELLVIATEIEEQEFWDRINLLKKCLRGKKVEMAVGAVWDKDGSIGLDRLMTEAEKRMYKDKAEYYKAMGLDRRKG